MPSPQLRCVTLATLLCAVSGAALAEDPPEGVEVFRVRGRAVKAIEVDVPSSVTRFDQSAIEALGVQNVSDLGLVTPNVEIRTVDPTSATFFIRGVGLSDFNSNAAGAVAIYHDGVPINAPGAQLGLLFDLEGIDIERGPQGTGLGRNASAGLIRVNSRKPTGRTEADVRVSYGNYDFVDVEGALELPIASGWSTRAAFRFSERRAFHRNGCAGAPDLADRLGGVTRVGRQIRQDADPTTPDTFLQYDGVQFCGETATTPIFRNAGSGSLARVSLLPGGLRDELGDRHRWAVRGFLRWQPEDLDMDWLLKGYFDRLDEDAVVGQAAGIRPGRNVSGPDPTFYRDSDITEAVRDAMRIFPGDPVSAEAYVASRVARNLDKRPRRGDYNLEGDTKNDRWGVSLTGEIEFDGAVLRSVTSYDGYDRERTGEGDFTPHSRFDLASFDDGWQLYQELMLSDQAEETPVRWEIGAYYLMEKIDFRGFNTSGATAGARTYLQDTWSVAAFAGGEWDFLDGFTLEAGIRFNWTRKTFDHEILSLVEHPKDRPEVQWEAPTGTIALRYALAKDVSVYWKYARGWKPGTYNSVTNPARDVTAAEPESIDSWEVGLRGAFFEGRLQLGVSAFYYRYQDYQVFVVVSDGQTIPQNQIENASDAQVYGAELDFQLEPLGGFVPLEIDGLRLTGRFGWLENQYLDFTVESITSVQRPGAGGGVVTLSSARVNQYSGNRLAYSPEFSFSMNTAWPVDLHRYGVITPSYDLIWNDAIYFGPGEGKGQLGGRSGRTVLPKYQVGQKPVALHHVRLAYRPVQHVEVAGWIRNLTDETVRTQGFDAAGRGVSVSYVGEPRTYGLDVSFSW